MPPTGSVKSMQVSMFHFVQEGVRERRKREGKEMVKGEGKGMLKGMGMVEGKRR